MRLQSFSFTLETLEAIFDETYIQHEPRLGWRTK